MWENQGNEDFHSLRIFKILFLDLGPSLVSFETKKIKFGVDIMAVEVKIWICFLDTGAT